MDLRILSDIQRVEQLFPLWLWKLQVVQACAEAEWAAGCIARWRVDSLRHGCWGFCLFLPSEHSEVSNTNSCPAFPCIWRWPLAGADGKPRSKDSVLSAFGLESHSAGPLQADQVAHAFSTLAISKFKNPAACLSTGAKEQATQTLPKRGHVGFCLIS